MTDINSIKNTVLNTLKKSLPSIAFYDEYCHCDPEWRRGQIAVCCIAIKAVKMRDYALGDYLGIDTNEAGVCDLYGKGATVTLLISVITPGSGQANVCNIALGDICNILANSSQNKLMEVNIDKINYNSKNSVFEQSAEFVFADVMLNPSQNENGVNGYILNTVIKKGIGNE